MTKEQYAKMLRDICEIHKTGGDTRACIAKYTERYKYVYVYNDDIFKVLLGNPANEAVTVDFLNAVLKLDGADCIDHVTFANPVSPEAFAKTSTSDIVADDQHKDRIVLEVQHVNGKSYEIRKTRCFTKSRPSRLYKFPSSLKGILPRTTVALLCGFAFLKVLTTRLLGTLSLTQCSVSCRSVQN